MAVNATSTPQLHGVLVIDLRSAVDDLGFLDSHKACLLTPPVPAGVRVEMQIGHARAVLATSLGEFIRAIRAAREVVIVGADAAGIAALHEALRVAFARKEATR